MPPFTDNYRFLARYNQWFNACLLDACETLTDEQRKQDRGAFFGSIHRTLNHLLVADPIWLQRFRQCGRDHGWDATFLSDAVVGLPEGTTLSTVLFDDWAALRARRAELDVAILQWLADMPADFAGCTMRYANSAGVRREHPAWQALTHFFNHQTHHRGQVTALLAQAGVDPGVTDLIALVSL
ncbi:MAG: DinB family protein [Burkholderiales bacterium]|nr:DinB family protein [Burkholderiales bacterium]